MKRVLCAVLLCVPAVSASACPQGARCLVVPQRIKAAHNAVDGALPAAALEPRPYAVGDVIPGDRVNVLLNTDYHGLPPSDGSFWYLRAAQHVYRIDPATLEVLGHVTDRLQ